LVLQERDSLLGEIQRLATLNRILSAQLAKTTSELENAMRKNKDSNNYLYKERE
jgi:hypothetical protein